MAEKSWRFLFFVLKIFLVVFVMLAWFQRTLIYHPSKSDKLKAQDSHLEQAVADVQVTSHDKLILNGWITLADQRRSPDPPDLETLQARERPLVIVFPGNAGNRSARETLLQILGSSGADAMIFDHRGFGDNTGNPSEYHLARDARAIWKFVTEELKVPKERIVLYGESLGGGVATRLAGDLGKDGIEPGGLIVQSSFNSLVETGQYHFPILPVSLLLIDRFQSEQHIQHARCPILHLHGQLDEVVPLSLGKKLFAAAPQKSSAGIAKQLVLLPNTNHNDVYGPDYDLVIRPVREFLSGVKQRAGELSKPK